MTADRSADLALDFEISVAGRKFFLQRSLALARRIESAHGAIEPFASRLDKGAVTTTELALLYAALLRDEPDRPSREEIDDWIFEAGVHTAARQVAWFVFSLICGNELLAKVQERLEAAQAQARRAAEQSRGPFGRAA